MKSKKNRIIIILAVLIIARIIIVLLEKKPATETVATTVTTSKTETQTAEAIAAKTPTEALSAQTSKSEACQSMRTHYQNLDEIKKLEKTSSRFVNIHKKVDGLVYRTRFFYKDSSENEIPTYLLYKEDQNDEPVLIETSPYKKGPQYLKIEKAQGEILFTEEGVNIGVDQDLFLHYENNVLKDLQGNSPLQKEKDFIECRF